MASHQSSHAGRLMRLAFVFLFATTLFLGSALPGYGEGTGGGGLPPGSPADSTSGEGGTSSYDDGTATSEPAATQDGVDASWSWTIDLLQLLSATVL